VVEVDPGHRLGRTARRNASRRSGRGDPGEQVGGRPRNARRRRRCGGTSGRRRGRGARATGGVLERLALEQAGQQQVALLPQGQLVVEVDVAVVGQQPAGLELDQGGGDEEELGGQVEVQLLHALELGQVGVDDVGQRDLVEVDLLAQDQVQEQVEGTLVDRHHRRRGRRPVRLRLPTPRLRRPVPAPLGARSGRSSRRRARRGRRSSADDRTDRRRGRGARTRRRARRRRRSPGQRRRHALCDRTRPPRHRRPRRADRVALGQPRAPTR
jgi:hypothetical protein